MNEKTLQSVQEPKGWGVKEGLITLCWLFCRQLSTRKYASAAWEGENQKNPSVSHHPLQGVVEATGMDGNTADNETLATLQLYLSSR